MEAQAAYYISLGYNEEWINAFVERIKREKIMDNTARHKTKKAEEKLEKVKQLLKCEYGRPKVKHWVHSYVKAKAMKPCEVRDCPTIAVRFVHVAYENKDVGCHMCLSHFNIAHQVLTDLP